MLALIIASGSSSLRTDKLPHWRTEEFCPRQLDQGGFHFIPLVALSHPPVPTLPSLQLPDSAVLLSDPRRIVIQVWFSIQTIRLSIQRFSFRIQPLSLATQALFLIQPCWFAIVIDLEGWLKRSSFLLQCPRSSQLRSCHASPEDLAHCSVWSWQLMLIVSRVRACCGGNACNDHPNIYVQLASSMLPDVMSAVLVR